MSVAPSASAGSVEDDDRMVTVEQLTQRFDGWQQRHRVPAFLVALLLRYREDQGRDYAAALSYYGFISLFPLLLALVTVLGIVLRNNTALQDRILDTVYSRIPVVGARFATTQPA